MITAEDRRQYMETLESMGYTDKNALQQYVQDLSDDSGVDISVIRSIIQVLGVRELFDGVVSAVEDYAADGFVNLD